MKVKVTLTTHRRAGQAADLSTEERALWRFEFSEDFNGPFLHRSKLTFTMGSNLEQTDLGFQASLFAANTDVDEW